jgi:hypothetical protein
MGFFCFQIVGPFFFNYCCISRCIGRATENRLIGNQLKHKGGAMTQTSGILQTGMQPQLINQRIDEVKQQGQFKPEVEKEDSSKNTDTVTISVNITNKPTIEFDPINEAEAINLAQSVSNDIIDQAFGMSTQGTTDALRNII